jgi:hypothetical protein
VNRFGTNIALLLFLLPSLCQAYRPAPWFKQLKPFPVDAAEGDRHFVENIDICNWTFKFKRRDISASLSVEGEAGRLTVRQNGNVLVKELSLPCGYGAGVDFRMVVADLNGDQKPDVALFQDEMGMGEGQWCTAWFWLSGPDKYVRREMKAYYGMDVHNFVTFGKEHSAFVIYRTACYSTLTAVPDIKDEIPERIGTPSNQELFNLHFDVSYLLRIHDQDFIYDQSPDSRFPLVNSWWKFDVKSETWVPTKLLTGAQKSRMVSKKYRDMDKYPVIPNFVTMPPPYLQ